MTQPQLRRIRWAVRATLLLGLVASATGNVLHAEPSAVSRAISAWPVLALYLTIELIGRVPIHRRSLAITRMVAAATIAGIAAWVSYWHMAGVAARYGETGASPYLLPLSVDGLIVVASICLVELGGRIRAAEESTQGGSNAPVRQDGQEDQVPERRHPHREEERQGLRVQQDPAGREAGAGREVAAGQGVKLSAPEPTVRKPPPSSRAKVVAAHNRTPDATNEELAARLKVSVKTIERHRPAKLSDKLSRPLVGASSHD